MDQKGQDILFNSEIKQKDLMIQMLSERLDEKDETITELKETINDLKETIAGLCKFRFIGSPIPLATDQCFRL